MLRERGIVPDYVAGHSLGEYSALVAAGSLTFAGRACSWCGKRGRYMQEAVPAGVGAMAAILKLPEGKLDGVLAEAAQGEMVSAANLNSPEQVVIAGHAGAVNRAMELAKAAGARRAVLLPVSAPFHCALMKPAQERLKADLDAGAVSGSGLPAGQQLAGGEVRTGAEAREGLYQQVPNPVRWLEIIRRLAVFGGEKVYRGGSGQRADRAIAKYCPGADWLSLRRGGGPGKAGRLADLLLFRFDSVEQLCHDGLRSQLEKSLSIVLQELRDLADTRKAIQSFIQAALAVGEAIHHNFQIFHLRSQRVGNLRAIIFQELA